MAPELLDERAVRSVHHHTILSSEVPHRRCCSWKTEEHEEQDSARLTVDGRMLTIRAPVHNVVNRIETRNCEVPSEGMRNMMGRMRGVLCLAVIGIVFTGCTKIVFTGGKEGLGQKITITSDPPGAQVFLMGSMPLGETPLLDVQIERTPNTFLILKKEGYVDHNLLLKHHYHVVLNPRKPSREKREQVTRMKTVRNLTLIGYPEFQQNLAVGHGEYLASLLVTLRVPESEQGNAIRQLQEIIADSADPLDFSDKVLDRFHVSRFW